MGLFSFMRAPGIDAGVQEYQNTPDAVLLDVRSAEEYREGHIPGSKNLPLHLLPSRFEELGDLTVPLFVYCLSGARSAQAVGFLKQQGFCKAKNIGGIAGYSGKVE